MVYPRRILVFRIGALGDTLLSIPALYAIRNHFTSNAHICLLRNSANPEIVKPEEVLSPHSCVNSFMEYPSEGRIISRTIAMIRLALKIRKSQFHAVIYLAPAERNAKALSRDRILFRLTGIKRFIGFRPFDRSQLYPRGADGKPSSVKSEANFLMERIRLDGIQLVENKHTPYNNLELTKSEREQARAWLNERDWNESKILIAIAPGSKQPVNSWPLQRFQHVGEKLKRQISCQLLVIGGPKEREAANTLLNKWGNGFNAAGSFPPRGSAALLELCNVLIGLDTGTTHLAASVGTPCVGLYSARDNPGRWHPIGNLHEILRKDKQVTCAGCMMVSCPILSHPCMSLITVDEVFKATLKVLARQYSLI